MTKDEFIENYACLEKLTFSLLKKAKNKGLLSLEDDIDIEKVKKRDIFNYGLFFVVNGVDSEIIQQILSNIINQEEDKYTSTLKTIQLKAILAIQEGKNPEILYAIMNSFTELPINLEKLKGGIYF